MSQYEKELDVIATRINTTKNLLKSFLYFCEKGCGELPINKQENFSVFARVFLNELSLKKSLLEAAIFTLEYEEGLLNSLFDEQEAKENG